ncbi:virulence factor TspB C-terminal domain-related protein [Acidovorax sp. SDU_ACID1]|uniref:virulence factor TspB C-terminal domain-related protein n=1 Tax=Acidovorax sp. SDU_ACID1 TaxID=3136632 RepID=UPI0038731E99
MIGSGASATCACAQGFVERNGQCVKPQTCEAGQNKSYTFFSSWWTDVPPDGKPIGDPVSPPGSYCDGACVWAHQGVLDCSIETVAEEGVPHKSFCEHAYTSTGAQCTQKTPDPSSPPPQTGGSGGGGPGCEGAGCEGEGGGGEGGPGEGGGGEGGGPGEGSGGEGGNGDDDDDDPPDDGGCTAGVCPPGEGEGEGEGEGGGGEGGGGGECEGDDCGSGGGGGGGGECEGDDCGNGGGGGGGGGTGGGGGGGGSGDGDGDGEEGLLCKLFPDTFVCQKTGSAGDAEPVKDREINASTITPQSGFGTPGQSCPAPLTVSTSIGTLEWSWDAWCQWADGVRPVVIALAWLSVGLGMVGFLRR